jgi:hypothetical protein
MSMATRAELVQATVGRYLAGTRLEKHLILNEFVALTGFHRKHAMRLLRVGGSSTRDRSRPERRLYDEAVRTALIVVWEASDRICGKRLQPLLVPMVEAMEWHGHVQLEDEVRARLVSMSAATIDRALREAKAGAGQKRRRRPANGIRSTVPVRTFFWTGEIPRRGSARPIWSGTAAQQPKAVSFRRWW